MKATIASLALVIAFCGLAIAQDAPPPPEGPSTQMGPRMIDGPTWWAVDPVWVTVVLENGGKTRN